MRYISFITLAAISFTARSQQIKSNAIFVQAGMGTLNESELSPSLNLCFYYEKIFLSKQGFQLGGQVGFGYWQNGALYSELTVSGQQVALGAAMKKNIGGTHRHFVGAEVGYVYVHVGRQGELVERVAAHHHEMYGAFSYQYITPKNFYGRLGVNSWQGLCMGLGFRF